MFFYIKDSIVNNYSNFRGRSSRSPYIYWTLVFGFLSLITNSLAATVTPESLATGVLTLVLGLILLVGGFYLLIPSIALSIRRLHDLNMSGWFLLISLIPFINLVFGIYLMAARGTEGPNNYGEDPTNTETGTTTPPAVTPTSPTPVTK